MNDYRQNAIEKMLEDFQDKGFQDKYGYIVDNDNGNPTRVGEATLHTAIAVIALATGNYHQDSEEEKSINPSIKELLTTLLEHSWGNKDNFGREHPIRHPDKREFNIEGKDFRASPLTKDSFGAIIAAAYYAYTCPNSDQEVRILARNLMTKWTEYLILFQWRTHSTYIVGEFETRELEGKKGKYYKYIFDNERQGEVTYKGIESFMLWPHEIYALQNVDADLGIPTEHWNIWGNDMPAELRQAIADYAAPYIAEEFGNGVNYVLQRFKYSLDYSIQLGSEDWNLGKIKRSFNIEIPSDIQEKIVNTARIAVKDLIRESMRIDNFKKYQSEELLGIIVNRLLNLLPDMLGVNSWRSILTGALQQVIPWIKGTSWIEVATFLGTIFLLRKMEADVISYTVWPFTVECETRPEMRDILEPAIRNFFDFLEDEGNPNGLWAWLAEDFGVVRNQLQLFESKRYDHAWKFAYGSTPFNKWVEEMENPSEISNHQNEKSPRLDYLVLDGLEEKGAPVGITDIVNNWLDNFKDIAKESADKFITEIKKQFEKAGRYTREFFNEAGELIRETWTKSMEFIEEKLIQGNLVSKKTWNRASELIHRFTKIDDKIIEEYWNRVNEKYWKGVWDKAGDMIERIIHTSDGKAIEEHWKREGERYWKGVWSKIGGTGDDMIERIIHTSDGKAIEEHWKREGERYWKGVWSKIGGTGDDMIERIIHTSDGKAIEEHWKREGERYWKGVWSKIGGTGDDMIERIIHTSDGKAIEEHWKREGERYWKGVWSKIGGTGDDMIERIIHTSDGKAIEEHWKREGERYWKGVWSKIGGTGDDMIERIIHTSDGKAIEEYWNRGREKYWKGVWSKIGGTGDDMIERIIHTSDGKVIEEHWKREGERYWKGVWSKIGGTGDDMIERIIHTSDGKSIEEYWNRGREKYWKGVWNKAGNMIERIVKKSDNSVVVDVWNEVGEWGNSIFDAAGNLIKKAGNIPSISMKDLLPPLPSIHW